MLGTRSRSAARAVDPGSPERDGAPARLRAPRIADAAPIWRLVADDPTLDSNSPYAYLLLCSHFARTGVVAEAAGAVAGFVLGYRLPDRPEVVFVWQVGVAGGQRGRGLGSRMLRELLRRPACRGVRALEATVTPENAPSRALFGSFARREGAALREEAGFAGGLFPGPHGEERLLHIGPLFTGAAGARPREA